MKSENSQQSNLSQDSTVWAWDFTNSHAFLYGIFWTSIFHLVARLIHELISHNLEPLIIKREIVFVVVFLLCFLTTCLLKRYQRLNRSTARILIFFQYLLLYSKMLIEIKHLANEHTENFKVLLAVYFGITIQLAIGILSKILLNWKQCVIVYFLSAIGLVGFSYIIGILRGMETIEAIELVVLLFILILINAFVLYSNDQWEKNSFQKSAEDKSHLLNFRSLIKTAIPSPVLVVEARSQKILAANNACAREFLGKIK